MSTDRELHRAVKEPLKALRFRKRAGGIFTLEVTDDVLGWLGLNTASKHTAKGTVTVNPVVGIRHQPVEQLVAKLDNRKPHSYIPPTVSTPIGYLMPEPSYREWWFTAPDTPDDPETQESSLVVGDVHNMVDVIGSYGLPFIRENSGLPNICRLLDQGISNNTLSIYQRIVAWMLAGDQDKALSLLDAKLREIADADYPAADQFRSFAANLHAYVKDLPDPR